MTNAQKIDPNAPLKEGEFRRIKGIAETTERALHDAGIETFDHLAMLTPEEIAEALPGNVGVKERAARQDWMGQAANFAILLAKRNPQEEGEGKGMLHSERQQPERQQHYASFMVVLLIDESHEVRRTTVTHIQDDTRESWAGWEPQRMTGWIADQAGISTAPPAGQPAQGKKPAPAAAKRKASALNGELLFSPVRFAFPSNPTREWSSPQILSGGDPFQVSMDLDLSRVEAPADQALRYQAAAQIHSMGRWEQSRTVHLDGGARPGERRSLTFGMPGLPEGTYHLDIAVLVAPESSTTPEADGLSVMTDGLMIRVQAEERISAAAETA